MEKESLGSTAWMVFGLKQKTEEDDHSQRKENYFCVEWIMLEVRQYTQTLSLPVAFTAQWVSGMSCGLSILYIRLAQLTRLSVGHKKSESRISLFHMFLSRIHIFCSQQVLTQFILYCCSNHILGTVQRREASLVYCSEVQLLARSSILPNMAMVGW